MTTKMSTRIFTLITIKQHKIHVSKALNPNHQMVTGGGVFRHHFVDTDLGFCLCHPSGEDIHMSAEYYGANNCKHAWIC